MKKTILFILIAAPLFAQTILDTEKAAWLARGGYFKDNTNTNQARAIAALENNAYSANQALIDDYITNYVGPERFTGNHEAGVMGTLMYFLQDNSGAGQLPSGKLSELNGYLSTLDTDDYYYGVGWSNTQMNCMAVRYIWAQQDTNATVRYDDPGNVNGGQDFSFEGRSYVRGQTYKAYALSRDWLLYWMTRYVQAGYMNGEIFSENYSIHFVNCLALLADTRMVTNSIMRTRAALTLDFMLLEHGMRTNRSHMSAPVGRTYRAAHVSGSYWLFMFDAYFGEKFPTHYGHQGAVYISNYRTRNIIEDVCRMGDEGSDYRVEVRGTMQRYYAYIAKDFTIGSEPDGGNGYIEITSTNNEGPFPQSRYGFNMRFWINNDPDDLNMSACDGECYAAMGIQCHQYLDAIMFTTTGAILHQTFNDANWDEQTGSLLTWRFKREGNVAVAIHIDPNSASAHIQLSRLGIDHANFSAFQSAVNSVSVYDNNYFRTWRGDVIENINGQTFVNGSRLYQNWPRFQARDITNLGSPSWIVQETSSQVFEITRHSNSATLNFSNWTGSSDEGGDETPPNAPTGFTVQ